MKQRLLFKLLFFIWSSTFITCAPEKQSTESDPRGFDQEYLESLNKRSSYDYDREFEIETEEDEEDSRSALGQFLATIVKAIAWFFNSVLGFVIIAFLVGFLVWILMKKSDRIFEKKRLNEKEKLLTVEPVEVEDKDYHKLIQSALKKQDFRLAIRFGFLSALKYLHKKELIEWKIDKTNLDYQFELPENYQDAFAGMCLIYERIWYGEFTADKELFNRMTSKFNEIKTFQNA